jgi:hypothetical protein
VHKCHALQHREMPSALLSLFHCIASLHHCNSNPTCGDSIVIQDTRGGILQRTSAGVVIFALIATFVGVIMS